MDKRDLGITIGICASLAVHVGFVTVSARHYAHGSLYYPSAMHRLPGVLIALKPQAPLPPPPPLPPDPREDIGEATGTGESNFSSLGDRPLAAPKDDEAQAWYTLQQAGQHAAPNPGQSDASKMGNNGRGGPRAKAARALADAVHQIEYPPQPKSQSLLSSLPVKPLKPQVPVATPSALALVPSPTARLILPSATQPAPMQVAIAPPPPTPPPPAPRTPTTPPLKTAEGDGRQPGAAAHNGDPAPHSDTDSDPFTKTGSVVFHNGKIDARFGRKVRITRPDLLLAGEWDRLGIEDPTVVLKISVDVTGNVSNVAVIQSSGTNDIDLPTQKAAYNWWFEPRTDAKGHPVSDLVIFTVRYR